MPDLVYLLNTLVDKDGQILIDGILDDVAPPLPNEEEIYKNIEFDVDEYRTDVGAKRLRHNEDKVNVSYGRGFGKSQLLHSRL